jgi:exonuclease VII large subunit
MSSEALSVRRLLRKISAALGRDWGQVCVEGEVASVRRPSTGEDARYLNFVLVDVGADRRERGGLRIAHRLAAGDPAGLREKVEDGLTMRAEGLLSLFGNEVELRATRIEPMGGSVTLAEYERVAARSWAPPPPVPPMISSVFLFEVAGTSRRDLDRWTTHLIPAITRVRVPGDDKALIATVRAHTAQILARRPDLVLFVRGGSVPDLSVWSSEALCEAIDGLQRAGVPVGAAVGHPEHQPLLYNVVAWGIDHPVAVAPEISAHNQRPVTCVRLVDHATTTLARRAEAARAQADRATADASGRLTAALDRARHRLSAHVGGTRARLRALAGPATLTPGNVGDRVHVLLRQHASRSVADHHTLVKTITARLGGTADAVEQADRNTTQTLRQQMASALERRRATSRQAPAALAARLRSDQALIDMVRGRFESLDGRAALLSAPDGGPAQLHPGQPIVLDLLDRRVHATVTGVDQHSQTSRPQPPEDP